MPFRGIYNFEVSDRGNVIYSQNNVELLRNLWLDRQIINETELGPGDPGDFDYGAWHIACHLVAADGVRRTKNGRLLIRNIAMNFDGFIERKEDKARYSRSV